MVAAATNNLCEAANAAVQGHASQEKLISSAKQVAASTAQLLVACKVKADQDSEAMKRLQVRRPDPLVQVAFSCLSERVPRGSLQDPPCRLSHTSPSLCPGGWQCSEASFRQPGEGSPEGSSLRGPRERDSGGKGEDGRRHRSGEH